MASSSDTRTPLNLTASSQIPKDMPGPDNLMPLSPQWLLPKPGENKTETALGESRPTPHVSYGDRSDVIKSPGNADEMHENQKKKDVFRPTFFDMESGRRDRWRDEERDTNSSVRKDRWREDGIEIGDNRRNDRWVENSPTRNFGEARRAPTDRRADPNKESNHDQRPGSKWTSRWGPIDKEMDKWTDAGKNDMPVDKGPSPLSNHAKDEKEGDHHRPWRPSSLHGRGRADSLHHHTQMTGKEVPTISHGRGRGDTPPSTFSASRGKLTFGTRSGSVNNSSGHPQSSGFMPERGDNGMGEPSPFRYNRTKLLDIFRVTDPRSSNKILDGLTQVPSLTQEEPIDPLAVLVPSPEESAILKGIEKGDIISSGAPQISKDGSSGRSPSDFATSRQRKLGGKEGASPAIDDAIDKLDNAKGSYSRASEYLPHENQIHPYGSNVTSSNTDIHQRYSENKYTAEGARDDAGCVSTPSGTPWRRASVVEPPRTPSRADMSWSQAPKDSEKDSTVWKHSSVVVDRELDYRKHLQTSPEDLILLYKDPHGLVQGPFSGGDIIGWFEAGYFGIDLQVRLASATNDAPFSLLGDVMPHLRAKVRPPPGFNSAKQTDVSDMPNRSSSSGLGHHLLNGTDVMIGNEHRHVHGSSTEAETKFLESLMSGEISSSSLERHALQEGLQGGFKGHMSMNMPTMGAESEDALAVLAKRMNLDRQKTLSNPYPYWPPRDATPGVPSLDVNRDSNISHTNPLSPIDIPRQSHPQNIETMSVLQGLSDRSSAGVNNGLGGSPNFHGISGTFKDKIELPQGQNFPQAVYGLQQHQQPPNHPSVANVVGQTLDSQGILTEKLLSSGLVQNPQLLNLLQHQYLLQLQSQQSVPDPQLSLLDRMLLLQQQQKQEEQQKLFQQQQLLQQQQQLLSKVLSEQQLAQRFGNPSFQQFHASAPLSGNGPTDSSTPQLLNQLFQVNPQFPISNMLDDRNAIIANMPPKVSQDSTRVDPSEGNSSLPLPHQMLGGVPKVWPSVPSHNKLETPEPALGEECVSLVARDGESESMKPGVTNVAEVIPTKAAEPVPTNEDVSGVKDTKYVESREVKKTAEKKSKKLKSSKAHLSTDQLKATSKGTSVQLSKQSEDGKVGTSVQSEEAVSAARTSTEATMHKGGEALSSKDGLLLAKAPESSTKHDQSLQGNSGQRTWKSAVSVKPKSLLEIQQEEAQRAQMEIPSPDVSASVSSMSSSSPWGGVVTHTESKVTPENDHGSRSVDNNMKLLESSEVKKSELHDLLAVEAPAKPSEKNLRVSDMAASLLPLPTMSDQLDTTADDNFIEAKDTKKSRRKAAKAKASAVKVPLTSSADLAVASSPVEKGKSSRPLKTEKEVLPAPSGPSLGDFVPWKGESTSHVPAPAWLAEPAKFPKPTSLRDILREQEKKVFPALQHSQTSTPQKPPSTQMRAGSRSVLALSPKAAIPVQFPSEASSQSKNKGDDDLFWGPPEQSKKETQQPNFPQLVNQGGRAIKNIPVKGTPAASLSKEKSASSKALNNYVSSPPPSAQISEKGKRDGRTKRSEAVDFKDWCESESVRLTGSNDTSFLEFCLMQPKSEAETLLIENLGSFDPNHEFIEKFLNYKEMLPADVLKTAFQMHNMLKGYNNGAIDMTSDHAGFTDIERDSKVSADGPAKVGKKKGKKGKKVSPSVLGFNVVSNRIMMGEIQTLED